MQDILNGVTANGDDRFVGQIERISWVTYIMDNVFIWLTTLGAFAIILFAMAKPILVIMYFCMPRFFDKLDEAMNTRNANGRVGTVLSLLSMVIPINVKEAIIDEISEGGDGEGGGNVVNTRKQKAIAIAKVLVLSVVMVSWGNMVYSGQHRDLVVKIADAGSYFFENYVMPFDLKGSINDMANTGKDYVFNYPKTKAGKEAKGIAKSIYDTVTNRYADLRSENDKWTVGANVEEYVNSSILTMPITVGSATTLAAAIDSGDYNVKFTSAAVPLETNSDTPISQNKMSQQKTFYKDIASFGFLSTTLPDDAYLVRTTINISLKKQEGTLTSNINGGNVSYGITAKVVKLGSSRNAFVDLQFPTIRSRELMPDNITIAGETFSKNDKSQGDYTGYTSKNPNLLGVDNDWQKKVFSEGSTASGVENTFTMDGVSCDLTLTKDGSLSATFNGTDIMGMSSSEIDKIIKSMKEQDDKQRDEKEYTSPDEVLD